jgi:Zn-finger nucleic acid-binding protein
MIDLKCVNCEHEISVLESEAMDNTSCPLCGGSMLYKKDADILINKEKEQENKTKELKEELDKTLIRLMNEDITKFGADKVWNELNKMEIESRLHALPIFLEATWRLKNLK